MANAEWTRCGSKHDAECAGCGRPLVRAVVPLVAAAEIWKHCGCGPARLCPGPMHPADLVARYVEAITYAAKAHIAERARIVKYLRERDERACLDCLCYKSAADDIEGGAQ